MPFDFISSNLFLLYIASEQVNPQSNTLPNGVYCSLNNHFSNRFLISSQSTHFIFLILYLELIYKHFILHNVLSYHTLLIVLFSTSFAVLFTLLSSLGKPKTNRIISIILSILFNRRFRLWKNRNLRINY